MFGDRSVLIKTFVPRDLFEQLRPANEQVACEPALIETFDHQFEQRWMRGQQFKKQTAQSVRFHEADKMIQRRVGVGRLSKWSEEGRTQFAEDLVRPRR